MSRRRNLLSHISKPPKNYGICQVEFGTFPCAISIHFPVEWPQGRITIMKKWWVLQKKMDVKYIPTKNT